MLRGSSESPIQTLSVSFVRGFRKVKVWRRKAFKSGIVEKQGKGGIHEGRKEGKKQTGKESSTERLIAVEGRGKELEGCHTARYSQP
jgi:hypothetical protein